MPQRILMPDCLSFFLMIGSDLSELAAHVASSVRDHCAEPDRFSVNCIALVGEDFDVDEETIIERDLYYSCPSPMKDTLNETALLVVRDKLQKTMNRTEGIPKFHYQFNRIRFVIIADTAGEHDLAALDSLRQALIDEMNADGKSATVLLCLTAENAQAAEQREWLMTDDGNLREEINRFEKVLLLTPHNMKGIITLSTRRDMQDVVFPALIMMMNGHMLTEADRLYTAAYKKQGGTSNDVLELRRHIAASVLENYFNKPDALGRQDILTILSTDRIRLDEPGKTLIDKAKVCAGRYVPELRHLVLTADLENKDFNPIMHIMAFDNMNRERMTEIGNWPEEWLNDVKGKILKQIYLDTIRDELNENSNEKNLASEILQCWSELMTRVTGEENQMQESLERRLNASCPTPKRAFLQGTRDYNMIWLNAAVGVYADICRERIAYRILTCLQMGIKPLRAFLKEAIDQRQKVLTAYQMENDKLRVLTDIIPEAARELKDSYTRTGLIEKLPTFIQYKGKLNTKEGRPHWRNLYHEFLAKGVETSSFSEAYIKGMDSIGVRKKIEPLGEEVYAMIPSYPDELGVMKTPVKSFLLNKSVSDKLQDNIQDSQVYEVPGDLLEHVSLFPMGTDLEAMTKLTMFRKMPWAHTVESRENGPRALTGKQQTRQPQQKVETNLNPWNIQIIDTENGQMLCWDYPVDHGDAIIHVNGKIIKTGYRYIDYVNSGMGLQLKEWDLASGNLRIEIECGSERQKYQTEYQKPGEPVNVIYSKTKVRSNGGEEFSRGQASDDRYDDRCLVFTDDVQRWRIPFFPFGVDESGMINPLWCTKETQLELEDI